MKLSEIKKIIDSRLSQYPDSDYEMVIEINENTMGPTPNVGVRFAFFGFDWDDGRLIIIPTQPLIRDTKEFQDERAAADKTKALEWMEDFNRRNGIYDIDNSNDFDLKDK